MTINFPNNPILNQEHVTTDNKRYMYDGVKWIYDNHSSRTSVYVSNEPPLNSQLGDLWLDSVSGKVYIYYQSVSGMQWVDAILPASMNPNPNDHMDKYLSTINEQVEWDWPAIPNVKTPAITVVGTDSEVGDNSILGEYPITLSTTEFSIEYGYDIHASTNWSATYQEHTWEKIDEVVTLTQITIPEKTVYGDVTFSAKHNSHNFGSSNSSTSTVYVWPWFDVYWDNVGVLLDMNGEAGSTSIENLSDTVIAYDHNGVSHNTTMQFPGYTSCLHFNGNSSHISLPTGYIDGSDFTIEAVITRINTNGINVVSQYDIGSSNNRTLFAINSDGYLALLNGSYETATTNPVPLNTPTHVSFSRTGSNLYGFVNGVLALTYSSFITPVNYRFRIGNHYNTGSNAWRANSEFYLLAFRFTKGINRYTDDYEPQKSAFPTENF